MQLDFYAKSLIICIFVLFQKGEHIPISAIPGCNDANAAREAMNSYLSPRKRKKKRKLSGGGGKWPRAGYSIDHRSHDSEDNRSEYLHKDRDDEEGKNFLRYFSRYFDILGLSIETCVLCPKFF